MRVLVQHERSMVVQVWTLGHLLRAEGVPLQLWTLLGEAVLFTEVGDALLGLKNLFLSHALQSLLPVLVHMDLELVKEVSWLDVRAVFVEDGAVFDIRLVEGGVLMCFYRRKRILWLSREVI